MRVVTNEAGEVLRRHDYLPFGEEWPERSTTDKRLFTGKERDFETGLDYFGARYYRAEIGRFTTVDPAMAVGENLVDPQRWNRYAYVRNNPLRYTDPDGRDVAPIVLPFGGQRRVTYVDTRVAEKVAALVAAAQKERISITFNSVFRTAEEQGVLVRTRSDVANKKGTSPHLVGLALDINMAALKPEDQTKLATLAHDQGFREASGERWHFQANEFITRDSKGEVDQAYRDMLGLNQKQASFFKNLGQVMFTPLPR